LDSIKTILHNEASKHGKVSSLMVKFDEKHKKYFAFVCYENKADAKKAYQELAKLKISDSQLEVNWAQKKEER
jgi:RNA recognition motif-containing protein